MLYALLNGLITGLILQLAIGPVFFFLLNIALQKSIFDAIFAITGVALADYIYIILAVLGIGRFLEKNAVKKAMGLTSSVILVIFGAIMIIATIKIESAAAPCDVGIHHQDYLNSFASAFILTISNPMTIVFWTGIFAARAIEKNYSKVQLSLFALFAGLATLIFLIPVITLLSLFKTSLPIYLVSSLNTLVGALLIIYGIRRFYFSIRTPKPQTGTN